MPRLDKSALAADAIAHVRGADAANAALTRIAAGTPRPDELGDTLIELLKTNADAHQRSIVRGFIRAISKHLELVSARAQRAR